MYRRALFERALPYYEALEGHLIMAEDLCFSAVLFYFARTISFSEYSWYFYYQHAGASTSLAGGFSKYVKKHRRPAPRLRLYRRFFAQGARFRKNF